MNKSQYQKDQIVWAKIKGFPWWPAIIARIYPEENRTDDKTDFLVNFIGDNSHARLSQEKVWDFDEKFKEYSKQPKSKKLMNSIKIANLIKNRLTTYEDEMLKLRSEKKRRKQSDMDSSSSEFSLPNSIPYKKKKLSRSQNLAISIDSKKSGGRKNDKLEKESSDGENYLKDDFSFQQEFEKMKLESLRNSARQTKESRTDDNIDYLLFSGEFERISRSKAKELNIEHKLTAPLQLENKGVLKKTTDKIREKYMKKTNNFKPKKLKEKIKDPAEVFDENVALENIVQELNENFWEIQKNAKKSNRNNYIFRKIDSFVSNFENRNYSKDDYSSLSKFGKLFKTIFFILKKLEEKKDIYDLKSQKGLIEKISQILAKIKKKIVEKSLDIDDFLQKNNYHSIEKDFSKITEEESFPDSDKSLSSPNQIFFTTNLEKTTPVTIENYMNGNIFLQSPDKRDPLLSNEKHINAVSKPLLRKKICSKLAKTFQGTFGVEKLKSQQLTLQLEAQIRMKYPQMDSGYKNTLKAFMRFVKTLKKNLTFDELKNMIANFDELINDGRLNSENEERAENKPLKMKEYAHPMPQSITTSPLSANFQRKK